MARTVNSGRWGRRFIEALEPRKLLAAGALDTSFSGDGKATSNVLSPGVVNATDVAVQADGQTVVAGTLQLASGETRFALARYSLDGVINLVNTPQLSNESRSSARAVAIAPSGKIVVVGDARVNDNVTESEMAIAVFNPNGSPDTTFSGDGKQTFDLGDFGDNTTQGHDVVVQPDGKIVVVGQTFRGLDFEFAVIRMHPNGALDDSFDGDGKRTLEVGGGDGTAVAVKVAVDGSIYIAGQVRTSGSLRGHWLRLTSNGSTTLAQAAFAVPGSTETNVQDLILQPDGKVVITGHALTLNGGNDFFIARFNANGTPDATFGGAGTGFRVTNLGGNDTVGGIARDPSGGGFIVSGASGGMAAVKYTDNGLLDTTFGSGGTVRLSGFGGVANIAPGPGRRVMLAGGANFSTARLLLAGANVVAIGALDTLATEGSATDTGSFLVGRVERLPTRTKVFLSITGTASAQILTGDYAVSGLVQPGLTFTIGGGGPVDRRPYIEIPENQTFVIATLTLRNDTAAEGTETATLSITPDASYEIGTPASGTIDIADDDSTTTTLGVSNDAYVRDGSSANTNFGSATELQVKTGGSGLNRFSYLKFNLSSFGVIERAKLVLFGALSDAQNTNIPVNLFSVANTSWSGSTLTFNNRPPPGATPLTSTIITDSTVRRYEFDVSNYVKQEKALGHNLVSFMLQSPTNTDSFLRFNSNDAASNRPALSVVTPNTVGVFTATPPPKKVRAGEDVQVPVTWTVPLEGWRQLTSISLRLRDLNHPGSSAVLRFNESANSFELLSASGVLVNAVTLLAASSTFKASSPSSPTVTVTFAFRFSAALPGHRFELGVSAANDVGQEDPFVQIGTIRVHNDPAA